MALEINLAVYSFQIRNKNDKKSFHNLDDFFKGDDIFSFFGDFINHYSEISINEKQQKSIQFTKKIVLSSDDRTISGILESGDYGVESNIADQNGKVVHKKKKDQLDVKPFYFLLWMPRDTNIGFVVTQRLGVFGIHGVFTSHFSSYFKKKYPDLTVEYNAYASKEIAKKFLADGGIREIILRRYNVPSDVADKFDQSFSDENIKVLELRILAEKNKNFAINKRASKVLNDPNTKLFTFSELKEIGFDGVHRELVRVKLGRNYRTIDISESAKLRPIFDIDNDVKRLESGHPEFKSIDMVAKELMEDIKDEIFGRI